VLDILAAMTLTALAIVSVGLVIRRAPAASGGLALAAAAWFAAVALLAAAGLFAPSGLGTPAIGAAVLLPTLLGAIAFARSPAVRAFALAIPLGLLVAVHAGRLLGAFFLALLSDGRLPPTFALAAGWGDILVGATAIPLALAIRRRAPGWRPLAALWNTVGLLDLAAAVSLGIGSTADSPVRFIHESSSTNTMASLPWLMIPGFLVPFFLLVHGAIYAQLFSRAVAPAARAPEAAAMQ
jgi:hypothetical protein